MKEQEWFGFSVAMSVYFNDNLIYFKEALNSILCQTVLPKEIVIVFDGNIKDEIIDFLKNQKEKMKGMIDIVTIPLKENSGLGTALRVAVENCRYDWIARMDSDDIASPDRFEYQVKHIMKNPDVDVLGGQIAEFISSPKSILGYRKVPETNEQIRCYMKKRCPMNHVTVMVKREALIRVGNYQPWPYNEDYYLWIRMFLNGCVFENLDRVLVYVRVGEEMYRRRGGNVYFDSEREIQRLMKREKIIGTMQYIQNIIVRYAVQVVMPDRLRGKFFRYFARKNKTGDASNGIYNHSLL